MYGFLLGNKLNDKEEIQDPKILTEAKSYNTIKLWGNIVDPVVKFVQELVLVITILELFPTIKLLSL